MFSRPCANLIADALDAIAKGLRSGEIMASGFSLAEREDHSGELQLRFDETGDDDDDEAQEPDEGLVIHKRPGGAVVSVLRPTADALATACPHCGTPATVRDAGMNRDGEAESLCIACNRTWVASKSPA